MYWKLVKFLHIPFFKFLFTHIFMDMFSIFSCTIILFCWFIFFQLGMMQHLKFISAIGFYFQFKYQWKFWSLKWKSVSEKSVWNNLVNPSDLDLLICYGIFKYTNNPNIEIANVSPRYLLKCYTMFIKLTGFDIIIYPSKRMAVCNLILSSCHLCWVTNK